MDNSLLFGQKANQNKPIQADGDPLANARQEPDGSIKADCPICANEDHPNKRLTIYANGAMACARFAGAGREANREHCAPIREMLGLGVESTAFITESLFDGTLTLTCEPAGRGKVLIVANNCESHLARDVIALDKAGDRAAFIKLLPGFDDDQRKTIHQTLLNLAGRLEKVQKAVGEEAETETKQVIFAALPDGRLIEQIAGGMFAVYDPQKGEVTYSREVKADDGVYRPLQDDFILKGGLFLPDRLIEYGDDKTLDADIEACIHRYSDVSTRELKLSGKYARLSYIADKLNEISYYRALGGPGSGKSRYICTTGMLCLRPVIVVNPSAPSLYRMMDAYAPTLIIDEANFEQGSEDATVLMQVLNSGFQRMTFVPRMDRGADGQMTLRMFSAFGPKLIGSLKLSDSAAFESRCVQVRLRKTARKDIPFRLTERMLRDLAELRAKLYLWRLRNWSRDYEQALDEAESELKEYRIEPRFVQIAIPVYGLIDDDDLRKDFARMLEGRTDDEASAKQESFDGQLVAVIHGLLFDVDDTDEYNSRTVWKPCGNYPKPEEGKPLELATIDQITATINEPLPEKKRHDSRWVGREVRKLGFKTRKIKRRESIHYQKSATIFESITFARAFENYSLPLHPDFDGLNGRTEEKANDDSGLDCVHQIETDATTKASWTQPISFIDKDLDEVRPLSPSNLPEPDGKDFSEPSWTQFGGIQAVIALDTETEPFDEKRGITPRTARLIGMAFCYDGDRADYVTDRESWPLMMPEPDQTVIFHNAKFDLLKLRQAGLPLPERWEDTMIAAHLLDENGEHGLKPLAKEHLGVDDPTTFEEADRMRLLDPEIFADYARNDARYTFRLWPRFEAEIDSQGLRQVYDLEKAVVPAVLAMEEAGLKLDLSQMATMYAETKAECARIKAEVFDHAGCEFDLNSPKKVATILYEKLGLPCSKETGTGAASVDKEALEDVRGYHPAVDALLRFREVDKLAGTFLKTLPAFADSAGRIHPEFKPLGAKTGRFSCSNPNVQQIPARSDLGKKLRGAFIAGEGRKLICADYSQMELRVLAHYSKDPLLLAAYQSQTETDLHTHTASRMFGKPEDEVSKKERSIAKMINFGVAYGITPIGLFNRLRPAGIEVSEEDCERFITDYFNTYSKVKKLLGDIAGATKKRGYVKSLYGRRRRVSGKDGREIRQAQNFVIQATAADMAKSAMVRIHAALPEGAHLIAMVHDEFIVECLTEQAEDVKALMDEIMSKQPEGFTVPLKVAAQIGNNWGECK